MTDDEKGTRLALFRLSVLGPLISADLEHGDRAAHFREAAKLTYSLPPDGLRTQFSPRTIESWFRAWKKDGLDGLRPGTRDDRGESRSIRADLAEWVLRAKREKPRRSIRSCASRLSELISRVLDTDGAPIVLRTPPRVFRFPPTPPILEGVNRKRTQRTYDHRLVRLVQDTGDTSIATHHRVSWPTTASRIRSGSVKRTRGPRLDLRIRFSLARNSFLRRRSLFTDPVM
jgi:hypothetical protein